MIKYNSSRFLGESDRKQMEPARRTQRGPRLHVPAALAVLLLSGCPGPSASDIVRNCFLLAPVCYLLGLGMLWGLRSAWRARFPDALFRPWLLSVPVVVHVLLLVLSARVVPAAFPDLDADLLITLSPVLILIVGGGLWTSTLLLWRALFSAAPHTSFERAALIAFVLFFAPWLPVFYSGPADPFERLAHGIENFTLLIGLGGVSTASLVLFFLFEARKSVRT